MMANEYAALQSTDGKLTVFNDFDNSVSVLEAPATDVPVDHVNINNYGKLKLADTKYQKKNGGSNGGFSGDGPAACTSVGPMEDGANGRLWKESDHGGTVTLNKRCTGTSFKAQLYYPDGTLIANLNYTGGANADSCGDRDHFRHPNDPSSFRIISLVMFYKSDGSRPCFQLGDVSERID